MKKQSLRKVIAMVVAATSIFALSTIGVSAAWKQDNRGWWNTEGNSYSKGWKNIDGTWYYFDNNGYMKTGWLNNGGWYYFSPSGAMQTGWIQAGGYWYYLKPNGVMAISTIVTDGKISKFDITGKWLGYANITQTSTNNTQQASTSNNSSNQSNISSNNSNTNTPVNKNSNSNQSTVSNESIGEFTIEGALKMISDYNGVAVTLTPPGPTGGIDGAYEKIHKDGKAGYYIYSYLFNGQRVNNSGAILIFEDGDYKQFLPGRHPSLLDSDEWIEEKELEDAALKDFLSHGQPAHDGSYVHYYLGKKYSFSFMQGMEQGTLYRTFHESEFDKNGYRIETAADYMKIANIRNN